MRARRTARRAARKSPGSSRRTSARRRCRSTAISTEKPISPSSTPRETCGSASCSRLRPAAARASPRLGPQPHSASCRNTVLRGEARLEEVFDRVAAAERRRNADEAGDDRADRERLQRERHRRRRLVRPVPRTVTVSARRDRRARRGVSHRRVIVRLGRSVRDLVVLLRGLAVRVRVGRMLHAVRRGDRDVRAVARCPRPARDRRRRTSSPSAATCRTPSSARSPPRAPR